MPRHEQWTFDVNGLRIVICQNNIVAWRPCGDMQTAIVNAANEELLGAVGDDEDYGDDFGGGGVDAALHRVAGPELRITAGADLHVGHVIHAVAPVFPAHAPEEATKLLEQAFLSALRLAERCAIQAVAIPALGCGLFGCPVELGARAAIEACRLFSGTEKGRPLEVHFVLYKTSELNAWLRAAREAFGPSTMPTSPVTSQTPLTSLTIARESDCQAHSWSQAPRYQASEGGQRPKCARPGSVQNLSRAHVYTPGVACWATEPCAPSSQQETDQRNLERLLNTLLQEDAEEALSMPGGNPATLVGGLHIMCCMSPTTSVSNAEPHTSANQLSYGSSEAESAAALELDALIKVRDWKQVQKKIRGKVWKLSCSKAGSEQLQQLLVSGGHVKSGGAKDWNAAVDTVISELRTHVMQAFFTKPNFSNYVLQACIQALSPERFKFILEELKDCVPQVAMDAQGCRVMQRIIEHVGDKNEHTLQLLEQILPRLREVAMNRYGNHVVQKFLEMASQSQRDLIAEELLRLVQHDRGVLFEMANSKFASHVLEKAMANASAELQEHFLCILETELDTRVDRRKLKKKKFGSFVWRSCVRTRAKWDSSPKAASSSSSCPSPAPFTPNGFAYEGLQPTTYQVFTGSPQASSWCPVLVPAVCPVNLAYQQAELGHAVCDVRGSASPQLRRVATPPIDAKAFSTGFSAGGVGLTVRFSNLKDAWRRSWAAFQLCLSVPMPVKALRVTRAFELGVWSSSLETYYPIIVSAAFVLLGLGYLLCLHIISLMLRRYLAGRTTVFPFWYIFLGVALSVALVLSVCFARLNYSKNMLASETLRRLAMASNVDPATDSSSRYLDIGRVEFAPGAQIDVGKYIGFKNSDLYCVAPIINKNATKAPASYDYWAVGLNCCDQNGFRCGEYHKPSARSGVRLLNEEQRQFYVLAVKEAEATFGITATTPLFFFWVEDANALQKSWKDKAMQYWLLACLTFTAFMFVATVAGVVYFESFYVTFW
ncbi:Pum2 [Symbiodinium necroappetens]|uniref:Pum2 protein n=1 Tax=Symbiodinium necroappetens TaxID=1628268 RepID=A0A812LGP7_9DINO|nr:Pum2 [Symbiodinium necroappetens]